MKIIKIFSILLITKIIIANEILQLDQEEEYFKHNIKKNAQLRTLKEKLGDFQNMIDYLKQASSSKLNQMKKLVDSSLFASEKFKINVDKLDI